MITIVSGTNRLGSNTLKVAMEYRRILAEKGYHHPNQSFYFYSAGV